MNNGVKLVQAPLVFVDAKPEKKYQVFESNGRFLVGRGIFGTQSFDIVDDCRTERFALARCDALNNGVIRT